MLVRCPNTVCQHEFTAPDHPAGTEIACPACSARFVAAGPAINPSAELELSSVERTPTSDTSNPAAELELSSVERTPTSDASISASANWSGDSPPRTAADEGPLTGQQLRDWTLNEVLGKGGMGTVYRASRSHVADAAVKVLESHLAQSHPQYVERFLREAKAASGLKHENVVRVFDVGEERGHYFMVMELVEGESLSQRLKRTKRMYVDFALMVVEQLLAALEAAHERSIVHRDIKPSNILLEYSDEAQLGPEDTALSNVQWGRRGSSVRVKLADLGLAKLQVDESAELTDTDATLGAPGYIAPEQIDTPNRVDGRADLYSVGCVLYHMLAGQAPFPGRTREKVWFQRGAHPVPDLAQAWPDAPPDLKAIVERMMAPDPDDRFASPQEASVAVGNFIAHMTGELPISLPEDELPCPNPDCNRLNPKLARRCRSCGHSLSKPCLRCGEEIHVADNFCIHCDTDQAKEEELLGAIDEARQLLTQKQPRDALARIEYVLLQDREAGASEERPGVQELRARIEPIIERLDSLKARAIEAKAQEEFEEARRLLEEANSLDRADDWFQDQLAAIPEEIRQRDIRNHLAAAREAGDRHRPRFAGPLYARILELDPTNAEALQGQKACEDCLERLERKKGELQTAVDQGELEQCHALCQSIQELDSDDGETAELLESLDRLLLKAREASKSARGHEQEMKWDQSLETWTQVLDIWPANQEGQQGVEKAHQGLREFRKRLQAARQLFEERKLGLAEQAADDSLNAGSLMDAVDLRKAVRSQKEEAGRLLDEATSQFRTKNWPEAAHLFEEVLAIWSDHAEASDGLSRSRGRRFAFDALRSEAQDLVEGRSLAEAEQTLIRALEAGNWPEGTGLLDRVRSEINRVTELLGAAEGQVNAKRWDEALQVLAEVVELWPDHPTRHSLQEVASENQPRFLSLRELAQEFWEAGRVTSALAAVRDAREAGHWPEGERLLREGQGRASRADEEARLGREAEEEMRWRDASRHYEKAISANAEVLADTDLGPVRALAAKLDAHLPDLRRLVEGKRWREALNKARDASKDGEDHEIDSLSQEAEDALRQVTELAARFDEAEAQRLPRQALGFLAQIRAIDPHWPVDEIRFQKLEAAVELAQASLADAKTAAGRNRWPEALARGRAALEYDSQIEGAGELVDKAARAVKRQRRLGCELFALLAASVLVLVVWYRTAQFQRVDQLAASFDQVKYSGGRDGREAEAFQDKAQQALAQGQESGEPEHFEAAGGALEAAQRFYDSAEQSLIQAQQIAQRGLGGADQVVVADLLRKIRSRNSVAEKLAAEAARARSAAVEFRQAFQEALALVAKGQSAPALEAYQQAIRAAGTIPVREERMQGIEREFRDAGELHFRELLLKAAGLAEWKERDAAYVEAEECAKKLGRPELGQEAQTRRREDAGKHYVQLLREGRKHLAAKEWQDARGRFDEALQVARDPLNSEEKASAVGKEQFALGIAEGDAHAKVSPPGWTEAKEGYEYALAAAREVLNDPENVEQAQQKLKEIRIREARRKFDEMLGAARTDLGQVQKLMEADTDGQGARLEDIAKKLKEVQDVLENAVKLANDTPLVGSCLDEAKKVLGEVEPELAKARCMESVSRGADLLAEGYEKSGTPVFGADAEAFGSAAQAVKSAGESFQGATQVTVKSVPDERQISPPEDVVKLARDFSAYATAFEAALRLAADGKWRDAAEKFREAQTSAQKSELPGGHATEARNACHGATYRYQVLEGKTDEDQGDEEFKAERYAQAAKLYEGAEGHYLSAKSAADEIKRPPAAGLSGTASECAERVAEKRAIAERKAKEQQMEAKANEFETEMGKGKTAEDRAEAEAEGALGARNLEDAVRKFGEAITLLEQAHGHYLKAQQIASTKPSLPEEDQKKATQAATRVLNRRLDTEVDKEMAEPRFIEAQAEKALEQKHYEEAIKLYTDAQALYLKAAKSAKGRSRTDKEKVARRKAELMQQMIAKCEFHKAYDPGETAEKQGDLFAGQGDRRQAIEWYRTAGGCYEKALEVATGKDHLKEQLADAAVAKARVGCQLSREEFRTSQAEAHALLEGGSFEKLKEARDKHRQAAKDWGSKVEKSVSGARKLIPNTRSEDLTKLENDALGQAYEALNEFAEVLSAKASEAEKAAGELGKQRDLEGAASKHGEAEAHYKHAGVHYEDAQSLAGGHKILKDKEDQAQKAKTLADGLRSYHENMQAGLKRQLEVEALPANEREAKWGAAIEAYEKAKGAAENISEAYRPRATLLDLATGRSTNAHALKAYTNAYSEYMNTGRTRLQQGKDEGRYKAARDEFKLARELAKGKLQSEKLAGAADDAFVEALREAANHLLRRSAIHEDQKEWQQAFDRLKNAPPELTTDPRLQETAAEVQARLRAVGRSLVDQLREQAEGKMSEKERPYPEAVAVLDKATQVADQAKLPEDVREGLAAQKEKVEKLRKGWDEYQKLDKDARGQLGRREWNDAAETYAKAEKVARDHGLGGALAEDAAARSKDALAMGQAVTDFKGRFGKGEQFQKSTALKDALDAFQEARDVVTKAVPLKNSTIREHVADSLDEMTEEAQVKIEALKPTVSEIEFNKHVDEGNKLVGEEKYAEASREYQEAEKWREGCLGGEADGLPKRIAYAEQMKEGSENEMTGLLETSITAYRKARDLAGEGPLPEGWLSQAADRMFECRVKVGDDHRNAQRYLEAAKAWCEASKLMTQTTSQDEKSTRVGERIDAIWPRVLKALVYPLRESAEEKTEAQQQEAKRRQQETAEVLGIPLRWEPDQLLPGVRLAFRLIPAGTFMMGSETEERGRDKDEGFKPRKEDVVRKKEGKVRATITRPYYLGETEVTQAQWCSLMAENQSHYKKSEDGRETGGAGDAEGLEMLADHPVENVNYTDCQTFLQKLSGKLGRECRLPTEAEWEAACRAGSSGPYWFSSGVRMWVKQMAPYMWFSYNADRTPRVDTHDPENPFKKLHGRQQKIRHSPVGINILYSEGNRRSQRNANPYGLQDMHGNVWEWCRDWYDGDYFRYFLIHADEKADWYRDSRVVDPPPSADAEEKEKQKKQKELKLFRTIRGGGAGSNLWFCRSAEREGEDPENGHPDVGFRVLVEIEQAEALEANPGD